MSVVARLQRIWDSAKAAPSKTRAHFAIPLERVDDGAATVVPFEPRQHYFRVDVSELFLAREREWFVRYDPMAFVATSHLYSSSQVTATAVVGPSMLDGLKQEVPEGMIFRGTPVTVLRPYQGGAVELTAILSRVARRNEVDRLLSVVESVASVVDPSMTIGTYVKMTAAVMDGVENLLGLDETEPIVGYRISMDADVGQPFVPGYFVTLDVDEREVDPERFHVRDDRLYEQRNGRAEPYRDSDFLLLSIRQATKRRDEAALPFYSLWQAAEDLAAQPGDHFWQEAKANFNALKRAILASPDLTRPDYERLRAEYLSQLQQRRREVVMESELGPEELDEAETEMRAIAEQLESIG
jgi:hypothetical protein